MKAPNYYIVHPKDAKPGQVFCGYETTKGTLCMSEITIQEDGTPLVFNEYPIEGEVLWFHRELTWEERDQWYRNAVDMTVARNQLNLMGLHNDLYSIGDARHEMWNGWIAATWKEQLIELLDEDFFIVGIADPAPPRMGLPMRHPVAVVIEYDDGDRYWCHAEKDWFDDMREESKEVYNKFMKGE